MRRQIQSFREKTGSIRSNGSDFPASDRAVSIRTTAEAAGVGIRLRGRGILSQWLAGTPVWPTLFPSAALAVHSEIVLRRDSR